MHIRKIILWFDNCSASRNADDLPNLDNWTVEILPLNLPSHIQSLNDRVIASIQAAWWKSVLFRIFDDPDGGPKMVYNVEMIVTMKSVNET